ncbi:MAG TPA: DUF99 family protein [Nitrososphaeraceae archaeon]
MRFHNNKKGIRVFAIAESFEKHDKKSILAGIVMRRDLGVDGIVYSDTVVSGNDGTDKVLSMITRLGRNDINCILLGGLVISLFNIINGKHINEITGLPVIAISYKKSFGLKESIHGINEKQKIQDYSELGERESLKLWTGKTIFVRHWGLTFVDTSSLLNSLVIQGARPEPLRLATLAARACRNYLK